jgi:hypothetical protein
MRASRPRSDPYVDIRCGSCGGWRQVTSRSYRRNQRERREPYCRHCSESVRVVVGPTEAYRWFWLEWAGAVQNGESAAAYVLGNGLPTILADLVDAVLGGRS